MSEPKNETIHSEPSDNATTGCLFIISAPSGAGKTTLCNAILKKFPDLCYSISHTTREPRTDEQDGVDYFFITQEKFKNNIEKGSWAEWAQVHGHFYGTSAQFIDRHLSEGKNILLDIDVNGAKQILYRYPHSITIFIMPPTFETLKQRLIKRGTDSEQVIIKRLINAETEIAQKDLYKHIVVNDSLPEAIKTLSAIISDNQPR
ncbi:MAG: guanylate kinase [Desulfobacteraceae bacterium]|nr:guanylate kinase [Desulfobacteraceae bacterium]MBC2754557.1 guanylate kinase [Desulfobacteraceae bacterium]MBC2763778.1 guanylate kinase [ANME-2 cluster archaeon]